MRRSLSNPIPKRNSRRLTKAEIEADRREQEAYTEEEALMCLLRTTLRTRNQTVANATAEALAIGMVDYRRRFTILARRASRRK